MICPNCGAENAQGAPYCYNCANPLPQVGAPAPGGTVPPAVPPGSVPPAPAGPGQTAQFPQQQTGAVPPGSVPPGGTPPPQWPAGGGGYEPPKPPKSTISAGLGGLIAFLVVAAIGAILFFTVFNKKDKAEPLPPTGPTPTVSVPATSVPPTSTPPTSTPPTSAPPTSGNPTTGPTTGPTTAPTTGPTTGPTTAVTTGPTTAATSGPTGPPQPGGPPSFASKFCKQAPTANTFGAGCDHNLVAQGNRPFFFVIRTVNIPKGVVFTVTLFDEANRPTDPVDMQPTNGQKVNRLIATFTPNVDLAGIKLVAVVEADGRATTCNGHTCSRNELASISFI